MDRQPERRKAAQRMPFGQLDDYPSAGVICEGAEEGGEIRHVVDDVVAHDHVGIRRGGCDVRPAPGDLLVAGSSLCGRLGEGVKHRLALIHRYE
jgi:hypothetical protein